MMEEARLVGHFRLPVSVPFDANCIGAACKTVIGGYPCTLALPGATAAGSYEPQFLVEGTDHLRGQPCLTPPSLEGIPPDQVWEIRRWWDSMGRPREQLNEHQPALWGGILLPGVVGQIDDLAGATVSVGEVVLDFGQQSIGDTAWARALDGSSVGYEVPGRGAGDPVLDAISEGTNIWWDSLVGWIRVLAMQSLSAEDNWLQIRVEAEGLHLHAIANEAAGPCGRRNMQSLIVDNSRSERLSFRQWALALQLAGNLAPISAELALISDARLAYLDGSYRLAVIHGGAVIEIMLRELFERSVDAVDEPMKTRVAGEHRTLGRLAELVAGECGVDHSQLKEVVRLRNAAVHKNATLTQAEALLTIDTALSVSERVLGVTREPGTFRLVAVPTV